MRISGMRTKGGWLVLLVGVVLLAGWSAKAQEQDESTSTATALGITADMTIVSQYNWRGYNLFDDHATYQPSVNWDVFGTGFSVNVWGAFPIGSGNEKVSELDYTVAYGTTLFAEERYAVDLSVNYIYYDFPKAGSRFVPDSHEIGVGVALPNLIPIGDSALVPHYYGGQLWPKDSGLGFDVAGGYHSFGLGYDWTLPGTEQVISLSSDINYNDGLFGADHDWTHATFGVSTSFDAGPVVLTPFLNYQVTMDTSLGNDDDYELYGGLSVSISF